MFGYAKNRFWLERPQNLVLSTSVIPLSGMSGEAQMNAITRLVLIVFVILILFDFKYSFLFLLISVLIIIILFYIQRRIMQQFKTEHFTQNNRNLHKNPPKNGNLTVFAQDCFFCNDPKFGQEVPIEQNFNDPNFMSMNQKLAGPPNPKTKIAPVVVPPITDLGYWRANNIVTHSSVNKQRNVELYQSGYVVSEDPPKIDTSVRNIRPFECLNNKRNSNVMNTPISRVQEKSTNDVIEEQDTVDIISTPIIENFVMSKENSLPEVREEYQAVSGYRAKYRKNGPAPLVSSLRRFGDASGNPSPPFERIGFRGNIGGIDPVTGEVRIVPNPRRATRFDTRQKRRENTLNRAKNLNDGTQVLANQPGWVNTSCGYNPKQLIEASLPTNLASGTCSKNPRMKEFNEDLYTQPIEPNVLTSNQINEPINSNIGISFTQQFPPLTCNPDDESGDLVYLQRDPRIVVPSENNPEICPVDEINQSNIYDPRFTGYGTGYRAYTDDNIGQTRFYYDDIDAIRMPNYIVRSKIDTQTFADKYGPIEAGNEKGNIFTPEIRTLVDTAFKEDALQFRTDLQARISRKINRKMWQRRKAPINTQGCGAGMYGLGSSNIY